MSSRNRDGNKKRKNTESDNQAIAKRTRQASLCLVCWRSSVFIEFVAQRQRWAGEETTSLENQQNQQKERQEQSQIQSQSQE